MAFSNTYISLLEFYLQKVYKEKISISKTLNEFKQYESAQFFFTIIYHSSSQELIQTLLSKNYFHFSLPLEKFKKRKDIKDGFYLKLILDKASFKKKSPSMQKKYSREIGLHGLNLLDGLWLITQYPELLKKHSLDLIESVYSKECIPTLYSWKERNYLSAICPDVSDELCAAPLVVGQRLLSAKDFTNANVLMSKVRALYNANVKRASS